MSLATPAKPSRRGSPKKFLKKGEGLKRFAAYNPPLPAVKSSSSQPIPNQRRQTFVKFNSARKQIHYLDPKILFDESINLTDEIPKIAPPKIIHTPMRPTRQALGVLGLAGANCFRPSLMEESKQTADPSQLMPPPSIPPLPQSASSSAGDLMLDKTPKRKVAFIKSANGRGKISFNGIRKSQSSDCDSMESTPVERVQPSATATCGQDIVDEPCLEDTAPKRYNLRGSRKVNECVSSKVADGPARRTRRHIKAVVERHIAPPDTNNEPGNGANEKNQPGLTESQLNGNIDQLMKKIEEKKSSLESDNQDENSTPSSPSPAVDQVLNFRPTDLSTPTPGSCLLALSQQIQRIESTVTDLKEKFKNCECGAYGQPAQKPPPATTRTTRRSRNTKSTSRPNDANQRTEDPTIAALDKLVREVSSLKERFDIMSLKQ